MAPKANSDMHIKEFRDEEIMVSVVVMAYNHKKFIKQALESTVSQKTTFPFEIILGEDESTDGTRAICIEYANRYSQIRLFLRSRKDVIYIDGRPTGRFNFLECLKVCNGKYIALLDGDDYWTYPFKLQKQVDFLESHPDFSYCFHNVAIIDDNGKLVKEHASPAYLLQKSEFSRKDSFDLPFYVNTVSLVFRNEIQMASKYNVLKAGDKVLLALLGSKGKGYFFSEQMACYRKHAWGATASAEMVHLSSSILSRLMEAQKLNSLLLEDIDPADAFYKELAAHISLLDFSVQMYQEPRMMRRITSILSNRALLKQSGSWRASRLVYFVFTEGSIRNAIIRLANKIRNRQIIKK